MEVEEELKGNSVLQKIKIYETYNYGVISENTTHYNERDKLKGEFISSKISKIRGWRGKNDNIKKIQIIHNRRDGSDPITTIETEEPIEQDDMEEEMDFALNEMISSFVVYKQDKITGFEVKTNKGKEKRFGFNKGDKLVVDGFEEGRNNYLIGFYLNTEKGHGICSIGGYYTPQKDYSLVKNWVFFHLYYKLKDEKLKKEYEDQEKSMEPWKKAVFKLCTLPQNQFRYVFGYIFY